VLQHLLEEPHPLLQPGAHSSVLQEREGRPIAAIFEDFFAASGPQAACSVPVSSVPVRCSGRAWQVAANMSFHQQLPGWKYATG